MKETRLAKSLTTCLTVKSSFTFTDKIREIGYEHTAMEELDETIPADPPLETLEESESVRQIKEEWTRLQIESDSLHIQLLQDAGEIRDGSVPQAQITRAPEAKRAGPVQWQNVRTLPRSHLPSLNSIKDPVSTFPSIRSSLRKNILEGRHGERPLDIQTDMEPPQMVTLHQTAYCFGNDTPTQTDIRWTPPSNAECFKLLLYDIEVDGGQGWTTLTESRLPILRVYFTSEKIIMGRFSRKQEAEPVSVRLRIRAIERTIRQAEEDSLRGPWSEEIWLTIEGSEITCNTAI